MRMSLRVPCLHQNGQPPSPPVPGLPQEWEWQLERSLAQRVLPEYGSGLCLGPVLRRLVGDFLPLSTFRCALDAWPHAHSEPWTLSSDRVLMRPMSSW